MYLEIMGYLLAVAVAMSGLIGARMQDSGEIARAYSEYPAAVLAVTIPYGISGLLAIGYFFWFVVGWKQVVAFFAAMYFLYHLDITAKPRTTQWSLFIGAVALAVLTEVALLTST
ncbi:MAG: hypothetical protein WEC99_06080 [Halofilum sp. (in: g-proteobacteria)]